MRPSTFLPALLALVASVVAQGPNHFNIPQGGFGIVAGKPVTLLWTPTTPGTITLVLRSGASSDLAAGTEIVAGADNTGSYTWDVPSDITFGSDYTIEIISDSDPTVTNFTDYEVIESNVTVASVTSIFSSGAPTVLPPVPTSSGSASASTSLSVTVTSAPVSSSSSSPASSASSTRFTTSTTSSVPSTIVNVQQPTGTGAATMQRVESGLAALIALGMGIGYAL